MLFLLCPAISYAGSVECSTTNLGHTTYNSNYDYSDAPASYGVACNATDDWNRLGSKWNADIYSPGFSDDWSDDGVSWSIDGANYGNDDILAGQTVTFKFDLYKELWGRHNFDSIGAWLDKNQDGVFSGGTEEEILKDAWYFRTDSTDVVVGANYTPYSSGSTGYPDNVADLTKSFYVTLVFPEAGEYWLRARVVCSDDLSDDLSNLGPTGGWWQGETEDYKITVTSVPEPATMMLLGSGLIGLAGFGRKKFIKK